MPSPSQIKGTEQEDFAERILVGRGYQIIERNWRCRGGEVDRIAWLDDLLVFVEVRSKRDGSDISPEESVGFWKRRRLIRAARSYLLRFSETHTPMVRFDVVGIVFGAGFRPAEVIVIENAFDEDGRPTR